MSSLELSERILQTKNFVKIKKKKKRRLLYRYHKALSDEYRNTRTKLS